MQVRQEAVLLFYPAPQAAPTMNQHPVYHLTQLCLQKTGFKSAEMKLKMGCPKASTAVLKG